MAACVGACVGAWLGAGVGAAIGAGLGALALGAAAGAALGRRVDASLGVIESALALDAPEAGATAAPGMSRLAAAIADMHERLQRKSTGAAAAQRDAELRRRVAEAELKQVEATLDSLRDAVIVTDRFDELTRANEAAARLLGFELATALHRPIGALTGDEGMAKMIRATRESQSLTDRKHVEHAIVPGGKGGAGAESRTFDLTLACLPDPTGSGVAGVVTILRDVTREKEISQMKSDFVSQVSHELRTPLSSINAYVEMLVDGEAKDEAARVEFYEVIKNEADRLGRLIDNMLNISRIEAGIIQIERTEVDFVATVKGAVEVMQPQARLKNITLISKAGPLVYTAQADRDMMHQVALNLISNAIKYTPDGGRVTVSVENDDATRSVMVSIADTGLGIPPDALDRVFEKFYRVDNYKRVAKGTGLGLSLVKHIVETVHGGQVGVSSALGMGSKFWFTIPFEPAQARRAA